MEHKLDMLYDKIRNVEERLVEERAKRIASEFASGLWSRFIVIVLAVLTAFVLTNVFHASWLPW